MNTTFDFLVGKPSRPLAIEIVAPRWTDGIAVCDVAINGEPIRPIQGVDPLNAMQNALAFVEAYVAAGRTTAVLLRGPTVPR